MQESAVCGVACFSAARAASGYGVFVAFLQEVFQAFDFGILEIEEARDADIAELVGTPRGMFELSTLTALGRLVVVERDFSEFGFELSDLCFEGNDLGIHLVHGRMDEFQESVFVSFAHVWAS
jgi:hypothetical protein